MSSPATSDPHNTHLVRREVGPRVTSIQPQEVGFRHLGFEVHQVTAASPLLGQTRGDQEALLVVLGGSGRLTVGYESLEFTGRPHVFAGLPHFAYIPRGTAWRFEPGPEATAAAPAEVALGFAPCEHDHQPFIGTPHDCHVEMRGAHNVERQITHLVDPDFACQRLLCVEVYTPSGNWSSYPPHKHDKHNPPHEVALDEVYHYRMAPDGFALQRLYDHPDHPSPGDEVLVVRDGDTVLVRHGYHPVVAPPGYDVYYLNILAGDHPSWAAADDPELAWVRGVWNSRQPLALPMKP